MGLSLCLTEHIAAPAVKESHKSSEGPGTLMFFCSKQPFVTDPIGPPGSSQSVGSNMGSLLFWVVIHGSSGSMLVVVKTSAQVYNPMLSEEDGLK